MWAAPIAPGATRHCMLPIPPLEDAAGGPSTTKVPPLSSEHRPLELGPRARSKRASRGAPPPHSKGSSGRPPPSAGGASATIIATRIIRRCQCRRHYCCRGRRCERDDDRDEDDPSLSMPSPLLLPLADHRPLRRIMMTMMIPLEERQMSRSR